MPSASPRLPALAALALCLASARAQPCPPEWAPGDANPGIDGYVAASVVHDDGSGPSVFVGGSFEVAGRVRANGVARWDGQRWHAVGDGISGVNALVVYDGALMAGGSGSPTGGAVFRWDGAAWSEIPTGPGTYVTAMTVSDGRLYVAGTIYALDGPLLARVGAWDGTSWTVIGPPDFVGRINAIRIHDGSLYAAGFYLGLPLQASLGSIVRLDGGELTVPGLGLAYGEVFALGTYRAELVATGSFERTAYQQRPMMGAASWNGYNWVQLGDGLERDGNGNGASEIIEVGDELWVGGSFDTWMSAFCDGTTPNTLARWDGSCWQSVGDQYTPFWSITTMCLFDGKLMAIGQNYASQGECQYWDGASWSRAGGGTDNPITAVTTFEGSLVVGGYFYNIGDTTARHVARRAGDHWVPIGAGPYVPAHAFAQYRGQLIASGSWEYQGEQGRMGGFTQAWDGKQWVSLDNGLEFAAADALLVVGDDLIGAGWFIFGDYDYTSAARWDGVQWHRMGTDDRDLITSLALLDGTIYGAGWFDGLGNRVCRWDGQGWIPIGGTLPTILPTALVAYRGQLYCAGREFIGRFDGSGWARLDGVRPGAKCLLHVHNGLLYAVSSRILVNGQIWAALVRYDGTSWSVVSGAPGFRYVEERSITEKVGALASDGPDLLIGGDFVRAGDTVSAYLARLTPSSPADLNLDGFIDAIDYDTFHNAFERADPAADLNHDGFIDGADYDTFHNALEAGC